MGSVFLATGVVWLILQLSALALLRGGWRTAADCRSVRCCWRSPSASSAGWPAPTWRRCGSSSRCRSARPGSWRSGRPGASPRSRAIAAGASPRRCPRLPAERRARSGADPTRHDDPALPPRARPDSTSVPSQSRPFSLAYALCMTCACPDSRNRMTTRDYPPHRPSAASSASRASTQRLPSGPVSFFQNGRARLQVVHQELGRREGGLAVRRGGRDHHDLLARLEPPEAVHDQAGVERPARPRLGLDRGERLLGHPGIVLELHRGDRAAHVAHEPGEADQRADAAARRPRSAASSAPRSKSSRCTRTAISAPGHRREEGHLARAADRGGEVGELLVDGDPHRAQVGEGAGIALLAAAQLLDQLGDGGGAGLDGLASARRPARAPRRSSAASGSPLAVPEERHRLHQVVVAGHQRQQPGDPDQDQPAVRQDPRRPSRGTSR